MEIEKGLFVILLVVATTVGWLVNNWIRAKHGYPLEDEWGGKTERPDSAAAPRLAQENAELRGEVCALRERIVTLERIVTDSGYRLGHEIEGLRDPREREQLQ